MYTENALNLIKQEVEEIAMSFCILKFSGSL